MLEIDSTELMIFGFDWKMRCVFTKLVGGCSWSCDGETSSSCKVDSIIGIGWVNLDCLIVAKVEVIFKRERAFWNKHIPNVRNWKHRTNDVWFRLENALCFHKTVLRLLLKLWWRNSFSCSVDSIKFGVKKCTALFDWHIIFPKDFTFGTTLPKSCLVQMKFQELGCAHACLDFLWFCKRVEMRLLDFPSVLNWTH